MLAADAHLFDVKPVTLLEEAEAGEGAGEGLRGEEPVAPPIVVQYLLGPNGGTPEFKTLDPQGRVVLAGTGPVAGKPAPGLHHLEIAVAEPGEYTVTLTIGDYSQEKKVTVKAAE